MISNTSHIARYYWFWKMRILNGMHSINVHVIAILPWVIEWSIDLLVRLSKWSACLSAIWINHNNYPSVWNYWSFRRISQLLQDILKSIAEEYRVLFIFQIYFDSKILFSDIINLWDKHSCRFLPICKQNHKLKK